MKHLPEIFTKYDEYWLSIFSFNMWFIKLRWYAAFSLLLFTLVIHFILPFKISQLQFFSMLSISIVIALYNYLLKLKLNSDNNGIKNITLNVSLTQILLDLLALSIIVYFCGGIEAPIFLIYIFHMIIGSLILPVQIMYIIALFLILFLTTFSTLEYLLIIPHQAIEGLYPFQLFNSPNYLIGFLSFFSFIVLMTIKLTNKISSELYRRESQLKLALDELKEAENSKQKYIMAVVHELKSPIVAALSFLDLVLAKITGTIDEVAASKISKAKTRLNESIININSILRISQYKLVNQLTLEDVSLINIVDLLLDKIKPIAEKKSITIETLFKFTNTIKVDSVLIELALSNLINNAVKYTPLNGFIKITSEEDENNVIINIADDGIGIPKEEIDRMFDNYYRASNVKSIEGSGTGLSTVKQIINSHKGDIFIKSPSYLADKIGPGTEFIIKLPKN